MFQVVKYAVATDEWISCNNIPTKRRMHGLAVIDRRLDLNQGYVFSVGSNPVPGPAGAIAELYEIVSNTWQKINSMPSPRKFLAAAAVAGGKVMYAFGGRGLHEEYMGHVEQVVR